ncbi:peptidyl-alpha-hydroxyglycine alpha-amidating lyase family protein [Formosa sp. PL04]|uniref:peptidyl-alpha-hydroxyglycine alpha-amidating lyase family protein n=1 Tax=Formosa sp. PL04 TaxID=3081755 RepID=UPI00298225E5|nr:peptidyl-alpha-hydroxyglycine alpha-amidating lyase family protein [Formosa sp. PL04]MDW5289701.1 peptidyl-alpha-hydroxyglycine alpha-amidating lyase family protein [Formosa sp. PL04]
MKYRLKSSIYFLLAFMILGCTNLKKKIVKKETQSPDSYVLVEDWPKIPNNLILGSPTGLGIDSENNILVFHRASRVRKDIMPEDNIKENTILTLHKKTGKVLKNWGADLFIMPHGLEVDKENNVWVTDVALHQVFKFSANGNLLLTLGEAKVPGNDSKHFNLPTDIAVSDDGSFYVSDGYANSRVVKFSKDGTYLLEWGKFGNKQGEFNVPHGIDLDKNGNVYVADRDNNRIQKFDSQGKFIAVWQNKIAEELYSVTIDNQNNHLFGIDYLTLNDTIVKGSDIFRFDLNMNPQVQFGRTGFYEGPISRYHDIQIDDEGSIYVGDILGNKVQKFRLEKSE